MAQIEICLDSDSRYLTQNIRTVCAAGIDSIELCSQMAQQGLSVSAEALRQARAACNSATQLRVMLRPRAGNFVYSVTEQQQMQTQLRQAAQLGADGIVVGALTADAQPDLAFLTLLLQQCRQLGLACTFHRAFDACASPAAAVEQLLALGVQRLLSNGTPWQQQQGITQGIGRLAALQQYIVGRLVLVAGGGVTLANLPQLQQTLHDNPQLCWHLHSAVLTEGKVDGAKLEQLQQCLTTQANKYRGEPHA
ncbi:copper homeostasis protein CutC [Rheinheimera sp.]|uniref:copper homeostasis protein CutC n=1 Tax=Rheinheimera sp. TaxID=1869214 RepID=UPI002736D175|nr:copper homeostasis protein CutC [Rheinheimera sp.]MDP2716626.1 copper homeostasis protein CutC [Rheinheimera sp.]